MKLRFSQLVENTLPLHYEIRQTITSLNVVRLVLRVLTQRTIAITNADLRDQRKHSLTDAFETRHKTRERWKNRRANKAEQPVRTRRELKHAIGGFKQSLGVRESLFVVSFQQTFRRDFFDNERQFPCKVVSVLNAGVHTLRAGRAVNVRGISRNKTSSFRKLIHAARVDLVK